MQILTSFDTLTDEISVDFGNGNNTLAPGEAKTIFPVFHVNATITPFQYPTVINIIVADPDIPSGQNNILTVLGVPVSFFVDGSGHLLTIDLTLPDSNPVVGEIELFQRPLNSGGTNGWSQLTSRVGNHFEIPVAEGEYRIDTYLLGHQEATTFLNVTENISVFVVLQGMAVTSVQMFFEDMTDNEGYLPFEYTVTSFLSPLFDFQANCALLQGTSVIDTRGCGSLAFMSFGEYTMLGVIDLSDLPADGRSRTYLLEIQLISRNITFSSSTVEFDLAIEEPVVPPAEAAAEPASGLQQASPYMLITIILLIVLIVGQQLRTRIARDLEEPEEDADGEMEMGELEETIPGPAVEVERQYVSIGPATVREPVTPAPVIRKPAVIERPAIRQPEPAVVQVLPEVEMATCGECNTDIPADSTSCPNCGTIFEQEEDLSSCPRCRAVFPASASTCPGCGAQFTDEPEVENIAAEVKARVRTVSCPSCYFDVPADATSCPSCGIAFIDDEELIECPDCGTMFPMEGKVCTGCGERFTFE